MNKKLYDSNRRRSHSIRSFRCCFVNKLPQYVFSGQALWMDGRPAFAVRGFIVAIVNCSSNATYRAQSCQMITLFPRMNGHKAKSCRQAYIWHRVDVTPASFSSSKSASYSLQILTCMLGVKADGFRSKWGKS